MSTRIIIGDCLDELRKLPEASVHCYVTSPPYWGLRDYGIKASIWGGDPACEHEFGVNGKKHRGGPPGDSIEVNRGRDRQAIADTADIETGAFCYCGAWRGVFGLEPTPALYVEHAVMVFREVRRVLRDDGVLWLNLGDSYATGAGKVGECPGGGEQGAKWRGNNTDRLANGRGDQPAVLRQKGRADRDGTHAGKHTAITGMGPMTQPNRMPQEGLKPKDLCEIPSDVVRALRADGWWLRSRIPWLKRNAMPESTKDRPTTAVEYVFLLSKSERYYYDGEAVKIKASSGTHARYKTPDGWDTTQGAGDHGTFHKEGREKGRVRDAGIGTNARPRKAVPNGNGQIKNNESFDAAMAIMPAERARRNSDWFFESWQGMLQDEGGDPLALIVNPQPFKEAHFATFPPALIEPCILAGCPAGGVVLDPFGGAGTTGLVADRFQRNAILIELNPEYASMAEKRIHADAGMFAEVTA